MLTASLETEAHNYSKGTGRKKLGKFSGPFLLPLVVSYLLTADPKHRKQGLNVIPQNQLLHSRQNNLFC